MAYSAHDTPLLMVAFAAGKQHKHQAWAQAFHALRHRLLTSKRCLADMIWSLVKSAAALWRWPAPIIFSRPGHGQQSS